MLEGGLTRCSRRKRSRNEESSAEREAEHLHGDLPAQRELRRLVHDAHPASPDQTFDLVGAEGRAGLEQLGGRRAHEPNLPVPRAGSKGGRDIAISWRYADTTPLFVRLPRREADLLDRVAFEGRISKRELVTSLVQRYLDDDDKAASAPELVLGRAHFRPAEAPDVLTLEQAAALLQVDAAEVAALAEAGELPGAASAATGASRARRSWSGWPPAKFIAHVPHHRLHRRRPAAR